MHVLSNLPSMMGLDVSPVLLILLTSTKIQKNVSTVPISMKNNKFAIPYLFPIMMVSMLMQPKKE